MSARFEIVDAIDRKHGPFQTIPDARAYINKRFRFQAQDDQRGGRYPVGWDIYVVRRSRPKSRRTKL